MKRSLVVVLAFAVTAILISGCHRWHYHGHDRYGHHGHHEHGHHDRHHGR